MSKRILLVEDDSDSSLILKNILTKAGYIVDCRVDGSSIVERDFLLPDVFILDNSMPTIDGIALCKYLKLKPDTKDIPVIMISGNHQIKSKAMRAGVTLFLGKPLQSEELVKFIPTLFKQVQETQ